jgi:ribose transport system ATP-binding protein
VSDDAPPLVHATGVAKHYGGEIALAGVDLAVRAGEIHALLGENGAGKSTLIKILAGVVQRDGGEIEVAGRALPRHLSPAAVRSAGLAFVHQTLGLLDHLTVAENVALASGYALRRGVISFGATERRVGRLLEEMGIDVPARERVARLSQDQKVLVAVARALSTDARMIVLDEVSSSLPAPEVARLAEGLRASRGLGHAYVYVTHRIDEVFDFADRLTVLRDGRHVTTVDVADTTHDAVVAAILGSAAAGAPTRASGSTAATGDIRLRVRQLRAGAMATPIDFEVRAGEIVGFCGLVGSGAQTVASVLGGALAPDTGTVELDGAPLPLGSVARLRAAGCTYVPGDRQAAGGVFTLTVRDNLLLTRRRRGADRDGWFSLPGRDRRLVNELTDRYDVRPRGSADRPLATLSGGNQQKVIVGRALRPAPRLLVVDDPTAGVDIGSRRQIHEILRGSADAGMAVVVASTDYDELAELADRVYVFARGGLHATVRRHELSADVLAGYSYATGSEPDR